MTLFDQIEGWVILGVFTYLWIKGKNWYEDMQTKNSIQLSLIFLRAAQCIELIPVWKLEAGYLAGAARVGDSEKTDKKLERQKILLEHYGDLRSEGKPKQEARRLASLRSQIPMATVKKWFSIEQIEKAYHQFT